MILGEDASLLDHYSGVNVDLPVTNPFALFSKEGRFIFVRILLRGAS